MSARSSRGRSEESEVTAARRSDSAGEESAAAMSAWAEERSDGRRWEGSEGNEAMDEAATSGSGKERSEAREESSSGSRRSGGSGSARRRSSARRLHTADDGAARISVATVRATADTSARRALLQRLQQRRRLPQRVRRPQVGRDLRHEEVHLAAGDRRRWGRWEVGGTVVVVADLERRGEREHEKVTKSQCYY